MPASAACVAMTATPEVDELIRPSAASSVSSMTDPQRNYIRRTLMTELTELGGGSEAQGWEELDRMPRDDIKLWIERNKKAQGQHPSQQAAYPDDMKYLQETLTAEDDALIRGLYLSAEETMVIVEDSKTLLHTGQRKPPSVNIDIILAKRRSSATPQQRQTLRMWGHNGDVHTELQAAGAIVRLWRNAGQTTFPLSGTVRAALPVSPNRGSSQPRPVKNEDL